MVVAALCAAGCGNDETGDGESGSSAEPTGTTEVTSSTLTASSTGSTGGASGGTSGSSAGTTGASGSTGSSESSGDSTGTPDPHCGWEHTYDEGLGLHDSADDVGVTPDGSIVVVGRERMTSEPGQPPDYQPWIRKLTLDGVEDWTVRVEIPAGESSNAGASAVAVDDAGLIYVAGRGGMEAPDGWIQQLGPAGDPGWLHAPEGRVSDIALDGATLLAAGSIPAPDRVADLWIARLDPSDGTEAWSDTRIAVNGGPAQAFAVTLVGGSLAVAVGRDCDPHVPYVSDSLIAVWDMDGGFQWSDTFAPGGDHGSDAQDVTPTPGGDIVVAGTVQDESEMDQLWLRAYDTSGAEAWTEVWGQNEGSSYAWESGYAVVAEPGGDLFVGGRRAVGDRGYQALLQRRGPDGSLLWTEEWGAEDNPSDGLNALAVATPTRLILAGTLGADETSLDAWVACWPGSGMP